MNERIAENGDMVTVHYTGRTEDGKVFASSVEGDPIEFKVGEGELIPGFEKNVVGMREGERQEFSVPPEEGFGDYRSELVATIGKNDFPDHFDPEEGKLLRLKRDDGETFDARITRVEGDEVTVDANHPLAGQTLRMDVDVLSVQKEVGM
jgi:peptidylprolyl isomerase